MLPSDSCYEVEIIREREEVFRLMQYGFSGGTPNKEREIWGIGGKK